MIRKFEGSFQSRLNQQEKRETVERVQELAKLYPVPCSDEELINKLYSEGKTWLYEIDDKVEAFVIVTTRDGNPYIWLAVTSLEHRGRGLASRLLDHVIKQYEGYRYISLHVDGENPSQTLYFKKGFRVTAVSYDMYGYGRNGLTMIRKYPIFGIPKI